MAASRTRNEEAATASDPNGFVPPSFTVTEGGIPARVGRPRNNFAAWEPVVTQLYDNLGNAFTFNDLPKCQTVANGLRREYGVHAVTSRIDKASGVGILHIEIPVLRDEDGNITGVDEEAMTATKVKYAKKS